MTWLPVVASLPLPAQGAAPVLAPYDSQSHGEELNGLQERIPLVLIHGILSSHTVWDRFVDLYRTDSSDFLRRKFKLYYFDYPGSQVQIVPGTAETIKSVGRSLGDQINSVAALRGRPLSLLAHSMGGLVSRSFMEEWRSDESRLGGEQVLRLTTLGTPHHGTPLGEDLTAILPFDVPYLEDMEWDQYDGHDPFHFNFWLRCLNSGSNVYFPHFACGDDNERLQARFFSKTFAFAGSAHGAFSDNVLTVGNRIMAADGYTENDGAVPVASALFNSPFTNADYPPAKRVLIDNCDHFRLPAGTCVFNGQNLFPRVLGPLVLIRADQRTYRPGQDISVTLSVRKQLTTDSDDVVDIYFGNMSEDGSAVWLNDSWQFTSAQVPIASGWHPSDLDELGPFVFTDDRIGKHAWIIRLVRPGSGVIDYSLSVYTVDVTGGPSVATGAATNVSVSGATLNGTVNPNGAATTVVFQWGTSTAYGNTTSSQSVGSGASSVPVSANVSGLAPNTTYHYRVVATSGGTTAAGDDRTFTTLHVDFPVTLSASRTTAPVGESVTLTATANQDVGATPYYIVIVEGSTVVRACGTGTTCTATVSSGAPATKSYVARIGASDGTNVQAASAAVSVNWQGQGDPTDRVTNGGFENGSTGWVRSGTGAFVTTSFSNPHNGAGYSYYGADAAGNALNGANGAIYQEITFPRSGTVTATLVFWLAVTSDEATTSTAFDRLFIEILNSSGGLITPVDTFSNLDKTTGVVYHPKAYNFTFSGVTAGDRIRLQFRVVTDSSEPTIFRVDDVAFVM